MKKFFTLMVVCLALLLATTSFAANAKLSQYVSSATGTGAIDLTVSPGEDFEVVAVLVHLSAAGGAAENFTVTIDDTKGAAWDVVLSATDMETATDVVYIPTHPIPITYKSAIKVAYTNTNSRTYGVQVIWRPWRQK